MFFLLAVFCAIMFALLSVKQTQAIVDNSDGFTKGALVLSVAGYLCSLGLIYTLV